MCISAFAAPTFNSVYAVNSTNTGFAINGMAYNPFTNHIIARSSTAGLLYTIDASNGQTTGQFLQPLPAAAVAVSGGLDAFGIGVDYADGAIYTHSNAAGAGIDGVTYQGAIHRFADENAAPTLSSATAPGLARTLNIVGSGSNKFIYWTGPADNGPIHIARSTDGGLTFLDWDRIPVPAGKSGVTADPRTIDSFGGATVVYGQEQAITNSGVSYKWIKVNPGFVDPTTTNSALRSDWVRDSTGHFLIDNVDTTYPGFNPIGTIRIGDSALDTAFNVLMLAGRGTQSGLLYMLDPDTGSVLGSHTTQEINNLGGLRTQIEIAYISSSIHRALITNRYPADGSGALGAAVVAIDYTPASTPVAVPASIITNPNGTPVNITVSGGAPPYTWVVSDASLGSLDTTIGSSVIFTPGSTVTTGTITVTDASAIPFVINVTISPTSAPLVSDLSVIPLNRKDIIRFDFFE
jgi:hypothetical protein